LYKANIMEQTIPSPPVARYQDDVPGRFTNDEARASGVSWAAVIGGAFVAAALSLIMLALGAGLGFSSVSMWSNVGASASAIGMAAVVWLIVMQIISSSMGGYLAGRLRTERANVHTDEAYFRDTAHGFLTWAVALVITAAFLASAATSMAGAAASSNPAGTGMAAGVRQEGKESDLNGYFVDMLLRSDTTKPDLNGASVRGEVGRIFANALPQKEIPAADKSYLAQLISTRTGLAQADAEKRVSDVFTSAQVALETARKTVAHSLLWAFLALLIGAFCASLGATIGGRQRGHAVGVS
jgi:hypothetical protein